MLSTLQFRQLNRLCFSSVPLCFRGSRNSSASAIPDLPLLELRATLDKYIVGHEDAKEGILLGLLAQEHVYIEGPPGIGKTHLAEIAAAAAGLNKFFYQFHRDTRIHELIGDATVVRELTPEGEVIRQGVRPGGMLTADVCILDDISRSPGEALNLLLRMLNERRYGDEALKLRCAIATGNPPREEFFNEPLDPAVLDRFTVQLCISGLLKDEQWEAAKRVMQGSHRHQHFDRDSSGNLCKVVDGLHAGQWTSYDQSLKQIQFPERVTDALLEVMQIVIQRYDLGKAHPALVTDRTFLVKAPHMMRARAVLHGRCACVYDDLYVLCLLSRFRLPEAVHESLPSIIAEVIQRRQQPPLGPNESGQISAGAGESDASAATSSSQKSPQQSMDTVKPHSGEQDQENDKQSHSSMLETLMKALAEKFSGDRSDEQRSRQVTTHILARIQGIEVLLESLNGSLQRSSADLAHRYGGLPRRWKRMRGLSDMEDADASALTFWCSAPSPSLPPTAQRERKDRGGAVAIIRDVSDSMGEELLANCASSVILSIIDLARNSHMRLGYSEFGNDSWKHESCDHHGVSRFFTRDYQAIKQLASNLKTRGCTHYQDAIRGVLTEFERLLARGSGACQRRHVVMISDGEPTLGCLYLHKERAWAQKLCVCIHTVFIGAGQYPPALARLAVDTGGKRFQAVPHHAQYSESIRIHDMSHLPVADSQSFYSSLWSWT